MNINLTLIAQALAFALFIWLTAKFIWPVLMRKIEERQKQIADGLAAGERGKQELEAAGKRAGEELAKARERVGGEILVAQRHEQVVELPRAEIGIRDARAHVRMHGDLRHGREHFLPLGEHGRFIGEAEYGFGVGSGDGRCFSHELFHDKRGHTPF